MNVDWGIRRGLEQEPRNSRPDQRLRQWWISRHREFRVISRLGDGWEGRDDDDDHHGR